MTEPDHGGLDPQDDARICNGRTDLVIDWVNAGNDATRSVGDGRRLIQVCAYFGDVTATSFLLARGEKLDSLGPDLGLNGAVFHGHWRLTEFLLSRGADANAPDEATGETPLHSVFGGADRKATMDPREHETLSGGAADPAQGACDARLLIQNANAKRFSPRTFNTAGSTGRSR